MKKNILWISLMALPLAASAHGEHDFHDAVSQAMHGLGHPEILISIVLMGILGTCVGRYLSKRK